MHEALISKDEMRYTWELGDKYIIFDSSRKEKEIIALYPGIKKVNEINSYSSDLAEKISIKELKTILSEIPPHMYINNNLD